MVLETVLTKNLSLFDVSLIRVLSGSFSIGVSG